MSACTKHAAEPVRGYRDCPGCEVESLRQQLAAAQAELSADAKWQAVIDQIADDEDRMHEQIELWARQSYRRSRSGVRGTTITRADSEVTHYVWAALRWAHEREQAEARELRERSAHVDRGATRLAVEKDTLAQELARVRELEEREQRDEAMLRQALEALEILHDELLQMEEHVESMGIRKGYAAIIALRERLVKGEQR